MKARTLALLAVVVSLLALATAAYGAGGTGWWHGPGSGRSGMSGTGMMSGSGGMGSSGMTATVRSEADYLVEMVAHHQEAISSARELERSQRPVMRTFGAQVVRTQSAEVERMRQLLSRWFPDRSFGANYEPMMRDLTRLSGDNLDQAFLDDMIPHHMTAVMMSQHLLLGGFATHEEVEDLAQSIRDTQHDEIVQMQRWRATWF